jgi:sensor histidine kinase YesM
MNRNQLISLLKINGLMVDAPEDDIRAVLENAKYSDLEIESALKIIKDKNSVAASRTDGLHRVFYTDGSLQPGEISNLLGVDISLDVPVTRWTKSEHLSKSEIITVVVGSFAIALITLITYMYVAGVGLFHKALL